MLQTIQSYESIWLIHYLLHVSILLNYYIIEQAEAELGQAQPKLRFRLRLKDFQIC